MISLKVWPIASLIIYYINTDNKSLNFFPVTTTSFFCYVLHLNKLLPLGYTLSFGQLVNPINHNLSHSSHITLQSINPLSGNRSKIILFITHYFWSKEGQLHPIYFSGLLVLKEYLFLIGFVFGLLIWVNLKIGHGFVFVEHLIVLFVDFAHVWNYVL